jgi:outer membrane immunogenic protein
MRSLLIGTSIALGMAASALAAPPYVAAYNWTGFYVGGNIGYSWGNSNSTLSLSDATTGAALDTANANFALDGIIGGGQIGYNYQIKKWVFGLEADIQGSSQGGSTNFICPGASGGPLPGGVMGTCSAGHLPDGAAIPAPAVTDGLSERLDWFGTVRGRLGFTITPTVLAYGTGGLAFGRVGTTDTISGTNFSLTGASSAIAAVLSSDTTKAGWTIGGGVETALGGHWTGKIEYLYIDLGSVSGSIVTPIVTPSRDFLAASFTSHVTDNILRVGVNYRF